MRRLSFDSLKSLTSRYDLSALVIYEYTLTFRDEIDLFWNRRLSGAAILFALNRYLMLGVITFQTICTFVALSDTVRISDVLYSS